MAKLRLVQASLLNYVQFRKKNIQIKYPQWVLRRQEVQKEIEEYFQNDINTFSWVKDMKTFKAFLIGLQASRTFLDGTEIPKKTPF